MKSKDQSKSPVSNHKIGVKPSHSPITPSRTDSGYANTAVSNNSRQRSSSQRLSEHQLMMNRNKQNSNPKLLNSHSKQTMLTTSSQQSLRLMSSIGMDMNPKDVKQILHENQLLKDEINQLRKMMVHTNQQQQQLPQKDKPSNTAQQFRQDVNWLHKSFSKIN